MSFTPFSNRFLYGRGGHGTILIDLDPGAGRLPRVVHFGADLGPSPDFEAIVASEARPLWGARLDDPHPPCVLPGLEAGWFGMPAIGPVTAGVYSFAGAGKAESPELWEATLTFESRGSQGQLHLDFRLWRGQSVLGSRLRIADSDSHVTQAASLALPLPGYLSDVQTYGGDWAREFSVERVKLGAQALVLESRRGRPGHDRFPGLLLGEGGFGLTNGALYAVTLGWSGGGRLSVERLREGPVMAMAGPLFPEGDDAGSDMHGPWAYAAFGSHGSAELGRRMQDFVRTVIVPPTVTSKPRPVHYNTWEAIYFQHDEAVLKDLATRAAALGVERFVLDDGWFKGREHDRAGLGDWVADRNKYPDGLGPLIDHVTGLGLEFGLWVEPEMVSPDSDLARAHGDWLRREADGSLLLQRHQAVLDLTIPAVGDALFDALRRLLTLYPVSYLKWDMNRDLTGLDQTGKPGHRGYVEAVYALIDRVRAAHPLVEVEACASGGGRIDYGMLMRGERVWLSDSNDALDRFDIQAQALQFLPLAVTGSHVGPAACHITGRRLSLDLRAHVALFGHMGLELDIRTLGPAEVERLTAHIETYKRFRGLLHSGAAEEMACGHADHRALAVSDADGQMLVLVVRTGSARLGQGMCLRFARARFGQRYRLRTLGPISPSAEPCLSPALIDGTLILSGQVLAARGLDLFLPRPETSILLHIEPVLG